jgi:1-acyl-sn-glycerol-3-phosphate acyltransferase
MVSEASIARIKGMFPKWDYAISPEITEILYDLLLGLDESLVEKFMVNYSKAGQDWGFNPYSPLVKEMLDTILRNIINYDVSGDENLAKALNDLSEKRIDRIVIVSNHLSYGDANIIATAFDKNIKQVGMNGSLSVIAGPKVYTDPLRKFSSMHFNALLIAQSLAVATPEAALPVREIARAAKKVVEDIKKFVKIFLVFPEGSRSRDGGMKAFLPGVLRLIDTGDRVSVIPVSIIGGNAMLPIGESKLNHADVNIRIGVGQKVDEVKALYSSSKSHKQEIMDHFGKMVADIHPENMRGVYQK